MASVYAAAHGIELMPGIPLTSGIEGKLSVGLALAAPVGLAVGVTAGGYRRRRGRDR